MASRSASFLVASLVLASTGAAQLYYLVDPAVPAGTLLTTSLITPPNAPFVSLLDGAGGPVELVGETFYLGFSPALLTIDAGSAGGLRGRQYPVPLGVATGVPFFLQSVLLDPAAPNGIFRVSDGESTTVYASGSVLVEDFLDPAAQGYTGDYDRGVRGRLQGGAVRVRVQRTIPGGFRFDQPIGPFNPMGERIQMVLRASDLGAIGDEELVTAIRWRPFANVVQDVFADLSIELSHSTVQPDFTVDPITALPKFPQSGLDLTYANNVKAGETQVVVYRGPYAIRPGDLRTDGYMSYPAPQQRFAYNGVDSLLLDFKMTISNAAGANGQVVFLQVLTSPQPNARVYFQISPLQSIPIDPHTLTTARVGDNMMHDMQIELTKVRSTAVSPWRDAGVAAPNYHAASVASSVPPGASITVEHRGSDLADGSNPTPWTTSIDNVDGRRFLQSRVIFRANPSNGAVPSVDAIVVPIN